MSEIRLAIAGVGNCASSLLQGVARFNAHPDRTEGLLHPTLGGYTPGDLLPVSAFDIDARKVGRPLSEAVFAPPNNTAVFHADLPAWDVGVRMAPVLDGFPDHMLAYPERQRFVPASLPPVDVAAVLRDSGAQVLVSYMPVGAQQATEHFAEACLRAGVAFVNCVPCFVVSDPAWARRFSEARIPCIGDDVKAQLGATITHRSLAKLFADRGVTITSTYQLNTGGNTDFLNMLNRSRLASKKESKTQAVQSQLPVPLDEDRIHIGPADYVPFQKDNKVCFLRIEGVGFGGVPLNLELRLSVEDSPNSAGVVIDAIRCAKLALDAGLSGPLDPVCTWTMKHPPRQTSDAEASLALEEWVTDAIARTHQKQRV